jgi:PhzF family phenazine biosynthesis protein
MATDYTVHVVNAFTDDRVRTLGNPAGIVFASPLPSEEDMAEIARQAGQPMTAFLEPLDSSNTNYKLRYYDLGGRECHICGHATVAASAQIVALHPELDGHEFTFQLNPAQFGGQQRELKTRVNGTHISIDLFPSILEHENDPVLIETISRGLGIRPEDIDSVAFSTNVRDYVVGLKDYRVLEAMTPDFDFLRDMAEQGPYQHEGMMVSAPADPAGGYDLAVRVFLPITGVNEDIACGSGNCSIIPYWVQKGLKGGDTHFSTYFPYPPGPQGYIGGVQEVTYDVAGKTITIDSQARPDQPLIVTIEPKTQQDLKKKSGGSDPAPAP